MFSLQDLCLEQITNHFETYYLAYSTTEDIALKLKFEFLQRAYSVKIVTVLQEKSSVKADYINFLINRYLKQLDTIWFTNCSWDTVAKKFAEIGPNLEEVIFQGDDMPWEKILCHLPNIKTVYYTDYCNDSFLYAIAKFCHEIETLNIQFSSRASDSGIKQLCFIENDKVSCPVLKEIFVAESGIRDDGIMYLLQNLPSLELTDYFDIFKIVYSIHKNDINALDKMRPYKLTELFAVELPSVEYDDAIKICISLCPHLKSFTCEVLKEEHLALCSQLSELEELWLDCKKETPLAINDFLKLAKSDLLCLELSNFLVSVSILSHNCPHLKYLRFDETTFQSDNNDPVRSFLNLKKLSFQYLILSDPLTAQAVTRLMLSSPNLKQLHFMDCQAFSLDIKTQILKCCEQCNLIDINIRNSEVEPKFLQDILSTCSSLKSLSVLGCEVNNEDMDKLRDFASTLPNMSVIVSDDEL